MAPICNKVLDEFTYYIKSIIVYRLNSGRSWYRSAEVGEIDSDLMEKVL